MQGPGGYNIESYEPTLLRPEEVKQNDNFLRRAFTTEQKLMPKVFNLNLINTLNLNNQLAFSNNMINNNYSNNRLIYKNYNGVFPTNINLNGKSNINMANPLLINNLKQNNIYANSRNNGVINTNYNSLQYRNIPTANINNFVYLKNNMPKYQISPNINNLPRNKVSQIYPTINQPMNMNRTNIYSNNKFKIPIYQRKLNKKKK